MTQPDRTSPAPTGPSGTSRRARVVLAGHGGDVDTVLAATGDPDPVVRDAVLGATLRLFDQGRLGRGELDATLVMGLGDTSAVVRRRAAEVAARAGGSELLTSALTVALGDDDDRVVEVAAFACGEHPEAGGPTISALARVATDHEDALCREAAVAALGSLGHPDGLPAVLSACRDRATVRRRAVLALAAFDGDQVTAELRRRCGDRDLQVRQAAEELLAIESGEPT